MSSDNQDGHREQRCSQCRHWTPPTFHYDGYGTCSRLCDSDLARIRIESYDNEGNDAYGSVSTLPEFGCVEFDPRTQTPAVPSEDAEGPLFTPAACLMTPSEALTYARRSNPIVTAALDANYTLEHVIAMLVEYVDHTAKQSLATAQRRYTHPIIVKDEQ